uniref:Uncharacterized protein n=1 Tax=Steinernema glaseri TaxID=37863 RepID=A0A1I7YWC4_9BILA
MCALGQGPGNSSAWKLEVGSGLSFGRSGVYWYSRTFSLEGMSRVLISYVLAEIVDSSDDGISLIEVPFTSLDHV